MHRMLVQIITLWAILCPVSSFAYFDFDLPQANRDLHEVEVYLQKNDYTTHELQTYQSKLESWQQMASKCIEIENGILGEILTLEQDVDDVGLSYPTYKQDQKYIKERKQASKLRLFGCRLFDLRAVQTNAHIQQMININLNAEKAVAGKPFWEAIQGILLTFGAILIFVSIVFLGNAVFDNSRLHSLALVKKQRYPEFSIFKFSLYALLASWVILMLLEWWGVPLNILAKLKDFLIEGTTVYGIRIIPMRLLLGIMIFALIQIVWKIGIFYVAKRRKIDPQADSQIVLTSLLSYVVFTLAILIGLAISGVNFTGLAIFAGALTVGLGFGLQNIVNNFVSGVILLIEKTIRPGDRVSIKGYEGYVRKINLRFTRISTFGKDDVLIPNSDLISTPIVNYEFDDKMSILKCQIGVDYGSDLDLVKTTLLNVALKHEEILNDPINQPIVYLIEFGDSNLVFELVCTVKDVNKKYGVKSDLHFQIANKFKENNISMSYPRRDVHLVQEG